MLNCKTALHIRIPPCELVRNAQLDLLRDNDIALCLSDYADAPAPWEVTASLVYIRGHGPSGRYHGTYSDETLKKWARDAAAWKAKAATSSAISTTT